MPKVYNKIVLWNFLIIMAGYPIISFLPGLYGMKDSQIFTIPYRIICVISAVITIMVGIRMKIYYLINSKQKILFLFFSIYLIRVTHDLYFSFYSNMLIYEFQDKMTYFFFIIGVIIIPMISIFTIISIDILKIAKYFYFLTFLALSFALIMNNIGLGQVVNDRISGNTAFAPILYGQLGVTGFLLSLFLWSHFKTKFEIFFYIIGGLLSLYTIAVAGSRSPFVALLICTFIYIFYSPYKGKGIKLVMQILAICFLLYIIFFPLTVLKLIGDYSSTSEGRILSTFDKSADQFSGRDLLYQDALNDFLNSPIIGKYFVLTHGTGAGWYPHNVILEAFMALGVIGGFIFIYLLYCALKNGFFLLKYNKKASWISLIFIQIIIFSFVSGSIYSTSSLWIMLFLLLAPPNYYKKMNTLRI